ncbi:hypothetical protein LXL04_034515 [Taraxacum kok-saghyz]
MVSASSSSSSSSFSESWGSDDLRFLLPRRFRVFCDLLMNTPAVKERQVISPAYCELFPLRERQTPASRHKKGKAPHHRHSPHKELRANAFVPALTLLAADKTHRTAGGERDYKNQSAESNDSLISTLKNTQEHMKITQEHSRIYAEYMKITQEYMKNTQEHEEHSCI